MDVKNAAINSSSLRNEQKGFSSLSLSLSLSRSLVSSRITTHSLSRVPEPWRYSKPRTFSYGRQKGREEVQVEEEQSFYPTPFLLSLALSIQENHLSTDLASLPFLSLDLVFILAWVTSWFNFTARPLINFLSFSFSVFFFFFFSTLCTQEFELFILLLLLILSRHAVSFFFLIPHHLLCSDTKCIHLAKTFDTKRREMKR